VLELIKNIATILHRTSYNHKTVTSEALVAELNKYQTTAVSAADDVEELYRTAKAMVEDLIKSQI
jgi:hypothetical protein